MATQPKRPRDPVQLAKLIGDIATGIVVDDSHESGKAEVVLRGAAGGKKGGVARAGKLTGARRSEIARHAATARWKAKTKG